MKDRYSNSTNLTTIFVTSRIQFIYTEFIAHHGLSFWPSQLQVVFGTPKFNSIDNVGQHSLSPLQIVSGTIDDILVLVLTSLLGSLALGLRVRGPLAVLVVGTSSYKLYSGERCEVPIPTIGIVPTIHAFTAIRVTQVMFQYVYIHLYRY